MSHDIDNIDNEQPTKKSLSEISHLFLTSVRDNATGGARPTRMPPGSFDPSERSPGSARSPADNVSIDVSPEEFAQSFAGRRLIDEPTADLGPARPPVGHVSALICPQLNGRQAERAREYARHLAAAGDRVGLIEVDAADCRVTCFELATGDPVEQAEPTTVTDIRPMAENLEELAWDVDRWVLLLPNPRLPEARALLRAVKHWTLLSTCDHDGVVSCYRAVKGLADVPRPRLTLALLDASDADEAGKVYRKIAGVCQQFLGWPMTAEPTVEPTDAVAEHEALIYKPRTDCGGSPQWKAVADFLARAGEEVTEPTAAPTPEPIARRAPPEPLAPIYESPTPTAPMEPMKLADFVIPAPPVTAPVAPVAVAEPVAPIVLPEPTVKPMQFAPTEADETEIADLPGGEVTETAVLSAVLRNGNANLIECPVKPPTCPTATLAVGRDRRLVLLAVAKRGLGEVRNIAAAYKWVADNRPLLSMALPQFAIDANAAPRLRLVVDRADAGADLLLPMSENANVTVQTYRKLRWGGRIGLLLEAA